MTFTERDNRLEKTFEFKNFSQALKFINTVGNISETIWHHPDMELFNYKYVKISTTTHDLWNKVTSKDIYLTQLINKI